MKVPNKFPFPAPLMKLINTPCIITFDEKSLQENGSKRTSITWSGKCAFTRKMKQISSSDARTVQLEGQALIIGDPIPNAKEQSSGTLEVGDETFLIYRTQRVRNPDNTVHHILVDLQ